MGLLGYHGEAEGLSLWYIGLVGDGRQWQRPALILPRQLEEVSM